MHTPRNENRGLQRQTQELPLHLTIFGAWMMAFGAASLLEYAPNASLWFPPAGVTFAAVLLLGLRALPALWLGCLVVTLLSEQAAPRGMSTAELMLAGAGFALTHTLAYAAIALLVRAWARRSSRIQPVRDAVWFLVAGLVAAGGSSVLGGLSLSAAGMMNWADARSLILPWWIGDFAGLITIAPLLAVLLTRWAMLDGMAPPAEFRRLQIRANWSALFPQALPKLALLAVLTVASVAAVALIPMQLAPLAPWLICPPILLWIAWSENELATLLAVASFSLIVAGVVGVARLAEHAPALQGLVIGLAALSYLIAARRSAHRDPATVKPDRPGG